MAETDRIRKRVLDSIGKEAIRKVKPFIKSKTLRESIFYKIEGNEVHLSFPYYWWVYVHYGSGPKTPKRRYMVWFRDPKDDPRTKGGTSYPRTPQQVKHLTREQFRSFLQINRQRKKAGLPPIMYFSERTPAIQGQFFFDKALSGGVDSAITSDALDDFEDALDDASGFKSNRVIEAKGTL